MATCAHCKAPWPADAPECTRCGSSRRAPQADPMIGRQIRDYTIESLLGRGGYGSVYQARHHLLTKRTVAVKLLRAEVARHPDHQEAFIREVGVLMDLDHPAIVRCFDMGRDEDGTLFVFMEKIEGLPLNRVLSSHGPWSPQQTIELGVQIASALEAAHAQGVLHRDLKPQNVLVMDDEKIKIIDFGIAKVLGDDTPAQALSQIIGTPLCMAPEQFFKGRRVDGRLDLYALGALLYQALTGRPPYVPDRQEGPAALDAIVQLQRARADTHGPRPSEEVAALSLLAPRLDALIAQLLSTDPDRRPGSAQEVEALLRSCQEQPLTSPASPPSAVSAPLDVSSPWPSISAVQARPEPAPDPAPSANPGSCEPRLDPPPTDSAPEMEVPPAAPRPAPGGSTASPGLWLFMAVMAVAVVLIGGVMGGGVLLVMYLFF